MNTQMPVIQTVLGKVGTYILSLICKQYLIFAKINNENMKILSRQNLNILHVWETFFLMLSNVVKVRWDKIGECSKKKSKLTMIHAKSLRKWKE